MIDQNLLRTAQALVFRHPGHPDQQVHNPHKGKKGKPSLGKGKAPNGDITVSDDARLWLLSDVPDEGKRFTGDNYLKLDPARHEFYRNRAAKQLAKDTGIDEQLVSEFTQEWAGTSNDTSYNALLAQKEAGDKFGIELSDWQEKKWDQATESRAERMKNLPRDERGLSGLQKSVYETNQGELEAGASKYKDHKAATRATLDAMYDHTQAELKKAGIESVTLYRGVDAMAIGYPIPDETLSLSGNVLESWSINPRTGYGFKGNSSGTVLKMEVPVERIFSTAKTGFGTLDETEFVVIGGKGMGEAMVMNNNKLRNYKR